MTADNLEERKLQYLNRSANAESQDAQDEIDEEYPDVVKHLLGEEPAKPPTFRPSAEGTVLSIENLIEAFGAKNVAKVSTDALTDAEFAELFPASVDADTVEQKSTIDAVLETLPALTAEELNQVLDALGPLIDGSGEPAGDPAKATPAAELAPGFPLAWRDLQWKAKVKLANTLGGQVSNATEADAFLTAEEAKLKGQ